MTFCAIPAHLLLRTPAFKVVDVYSIVVLRVSGAGFRDV